MTLGFACDASGLDIPFRHIRRAVPGAKVA